METYNILLHSIVLLITISLFFAIKKYKKISTSKALLPPGSTGLPFIGETLQMYNQDPNFFFSSRLQRYGEVFKTSILGCPCVMLASVEASKFVLVKQAHLFKPTFPKSKERLIGPSALFFHGGPYHLRLRRLVQAAFRPEFLRAISPHVEKLIRASLSSWSDENGGVSAFYLMKKLSFDTGVLAIFGGKLDDLHAKALSENYCIVDKGYNSLPLNFPPTPFHKAIQARGELRKIVGEIMRERRNKKEARDNLITALMETKNENGEHLNDDEIIDNVIGVLFAAQDTTASTLTWILKYLHDYPKVLEEVTKEHVSIYEENGFGAEPLTWAQTRSMVVTQRVIMESLRMSSIISFTFREAVANVEYKGYLIPKGWKVMPLFRSIHHNPKIHPHPHEFNPSRFKVAPKPNTFLPFGNGVHSCPGSELAKLQIFIFIYHLVTKYKLEIVEPSSEIEYRPFPVPKHGLLAKLHRKDM